MGIGITLEGYEINYYHYYTYQTFYLEFTTNLSLYNSFVHHFYSLFLHNQPLFRFDNGNSSLKFVGKDWVTQFVSNLAGWLDQSLNSNCCKVEIESKTKLGVKHSNLTKKCVISGTGSKVLS